MYGSEMDSWWQQPCAAWAREENNIDNLFEYQMVVQLASAKMFADGDYL